MAEPSSRPREADSRTQYSVSKLPRFPLVPSFLIPFCDVLDHSLSSDLLKYSKCCAFICSYFVSKSSYLRTTRIMISELVSLYKQTLSFALKRTKPENKTMQFSSCPHRCTEKSSSKVSSQLGKKPASLRTRSHLRGHAFLLCKQMLSRTT